jgi:hypothetical protein
LDRVRTIERRALFLVSVPVVIFLSTAVLTGGMGPLAVFESGQQVATLRLLHLGEFPWRDFLMFHGLFTDTFIPAVGYRLLDPSAWGALAGIALIVTPLTWITMYLFAYRVVGVSWAAIVAVVLLFFNTTLGFNGFSLSFGGGQRFLLWPLVLILLAVTLDRGSRWAALCLGGALVAFAILLPEGSYALPAIGVVIVAHDAYHARWPRIRWMRDFTVSLSSIAGGIIVASTVLIILAANHAVGSFIDYYVTLVPGHDLEGALPIPFTVFSPSAGPLTFWILAPGVAVLFVAVYLAVRVRLRRALRTNHFLLMATGLFVILYYQEFTGRADMPHLAFLYDTTLPLLLLCGWELGGLLNGWLCSCLREVPSWVRGSHAGTIRWPFWYLLVAASALTTSTSVPTLAASAPANFRASAPAEPWLPSLGYMDYGSEAVYSDLGHFLNAFLPAGAEIYDFSNEPGVYFYILDYRPATPHFAAVDDISQGSQDETVAELRAHPPAFVVIAGSAYNGMTSWDGIVNAVREYDIAQYLLDEYRPFADVDGELIYANRTLHPQIPSSLASQLGPALTTADLPFQYPTCNWGDVPEFLDVPPPAGGSMTVVGGAATPSDEWSLSEPPGGSWSAYQWIQFTIAPGSPAAALTLRDRDVPGQQHDIAFQTLAGGETSYQFPIGACPQWHGYSLPALQLTSSVPMMITQVRLLP